ncbi:MAG: bifunctional glutamate N-acetyltransferase/amino-acid acetyltransferase ArgJ [Candidatus Nanopelagicales bacterium]
MSTTAARGFTAAGVVAGLKSTGKPDLALVVNQGPKFAAAGVFTTNRVKAAPVRWTQELFAEGRSPRAVVLNSGGANACTGPQGLADTEATAALVAELTGLRTNQVAVCSTGLIGQLLPMEKLLAGVRAAHGELSRIGGDDAALAIMTTDSVPKTAVRMGNGFIVGGMAKGAGMLAPSLATMLVVITTDADLSPEQLDVALRAATNRSFDRIDSDGCMSTNDTVLLLASGASGVTPPEGEFALLLEQVCAELALKLIGDAEGAHKDVRIHVSSAASEADAIDVARAVSRSSLLKCAITGEDPNWGRVLAAIGTTDAMFDPDEIDVAINGIWVCRDGMAGDDRDLVDMSGRQVTITISLRAGDDEATLWTNDLTAEYVHENSAYSS